MAVTYAQPTPLDSLDPIELGLALDEAVAVALIWLHAMPNHDAGTSHTTICGII